ncbi:hypothetical protein GF339_11040 [candidate division KSB3 bacterium]|uniref:ABC transporter permease n=1 Tax=candidate division KSB3 bacterium TaxID=2044937 RepID=A0A9D5Q6P0_9BACT|nr:hypothetical protein [candidate division KSB3 bacterium]MBD3325111.1 hypothetical protein [candidate division KSB3 bacterium]
MELPPQNTTSWKRCSNMSDKKAAMQTLAKFIKTHTQLVFLYAVLCGILILASVFSPYFRTSENLFNILAQAVPLGLVAFGQTIVLLTAGVDLSVGGVMSTATALCAVIIQPGAGYAWVVVAVLAVVAVGIGFGLLNGVSRTHLGLPPFIATLCTLMISQGIALAILPRPGGYIADHLMSFIAYEFGAFRLPVVYFFGVMILLYVLLRYYPLGRCFYAIGGNPEAVKASGLAVNRIILHAHILCSVLAAVGGLFLVARIKSGDPNVGTPFVLDSIVAALIGGTTFTGGRGGVIGTTAGVLILALISNVLNMYSVNPFYQYIIKGLLFVVAIFAYSYKRR